MLCVCSRARVCVGFCGLQTLAVTQVPLSREEVLILYTSWVFCCLVSCVCVSWFWWVVGCVCAVQANQKRQTKATPTSPQSTDSVSVRPSVRAGAGVCVRVRFMDVCGCVWMGESVRKEIEHTSRTLSPTISHVLLSITQRLETLSI